MRMRVVIKKSERKNTKGFIVIVVMVIILITHRDRQRSAHTGFPSCLTQ
jgi:hypothetical protein